jgi:hypothetical protein
VKRLKRACHCQWAVALVCTPVVALVCTRAPAVCATPAFVWLAAFCATFPFIPASLVAWLFPSFPLAETPAEPDEELAVFPLLPLAWVEEEAVTEAFTCILSFAWLAVLTVFASVFSVVLTVFCAVVFAEVALERRALLTPGVLTLVAVLRLVVLAAPRRSWAEEEVLRAKETPAIKQIAIVFIIPVLIV